jgi:SAM-dependent methyltransferase
MDKRRQTVVRRQQTRGQSRAWFTLQEPDQAVRQWSQTLAQSGRRHVLDVGCGGGRHVVYLGRLGLAVTAGDQAAFALTETQRWLVRERLQADLVQLEMTALPFQSETFDAVLSVNVLQHADPEQARAAVQEVWRVLRPGGLFLAVLAGPGDCQCLLERPAADRQEAQGYNIRASSTHPPLCNERDLRGLFASFRVLETQRRSLGPPAEYGAPGWRGVNWRVWAERP